MKFSYRLLFALVFIFISLSLFAQNPDISGDWDGAIQVPGNQLAVNLHFQKDAQKWTGTIDIPVQKIDAMQLEAVTYEDKKLSFKLPNVPGNAHYEGVVSDDGKKINGEFKQAGQAFVLNLIQKSAADKAADEAKTKLAIQEYRILVDSLRKLQHIVGMSLALVKDDKVLISQGFGERELGKGNAVDDKTLFAIGSSSKAFTAASLAILADENKLDWEKPIKNYLPDFKMYDDFATEEMTATDLMCHRSGLPRHDFAWYGSSASREELYKRIQFLKPNKSFRSAWQYQNFMVMTAGYLAGKINGSTWEALVQKRILDPLGMKNTGFSVKDLEASTNAAKGYNWDKEKDASIYMPYRNIDAIGPAGSINSNAQDMSAWLRLQLANGKFDGKEIISATQMSNMHMPHMSMGRPSSGDGISSLSYGLGWMVYEYKGHRVVEHGGNIDGFSAQVFLMPDDNFGLVFLTNENATQLPTMLCLMAADKFLSLEPTDWYAKMYGQQEAKKDEKKFEPDAPEPVKGTKPSHELSDYTGEYFDPGYGTVVVTMDGKSLHASFNSSEFDMAHWHYDVFNGHVEALDEDILFAFHSSKEGDIYQLDIAFETSSPDIEFIKLPPAKLSEPDFLKTLVGNFEFAEGKLKIEIVIVGENVLQANIQGQQARSLEPWKGTQFKLKDLNGYSIEFVKSKNGKYDEAIIRQPGVVVEGKRAEEK